MTLTKHQNALVVAMEYRAVLHIPCMMLQQLVRWDIQWVRPTQFNTQSGINNGENEPVFSDVYGLEPVYSLSSRSRYHKGRAAFAQTRYTATESLGLSVPLFPYTSYMFAPHIVY